MAKQTPLPAGTLPTSRCKKYMRWFLMGGLFLAVGSTIAGWVAVVGWSYPVARLSPERGGPLLIQDRNGVLLRSVSHPQGRPGRQAWVPLAKIPVEALYTLLASEDIRFFQHPGVDVWSLLRMAWLNLKAKRLAYGASTITMQLMRLVHSPGQPRNVTNKLREILLALRLERAMSKREILEQYFNRAYYGHGAYGLDAAARVYFDQSAESLSVAEIALLSVLPRAPHRYDLFAHLPRALKRREKLFVLLQKRGFLSAKQVQQARVQRLSIKRKQLSFRAPHFVDWVLAQLPLHIRQRGGIVRTTLDIRLQEQLLSQIRLHVDSLRHRGLQQAAIVVLDSQTGEIRAMIGSTHYRRSHGQLNMATTPRSPGSALKPFLYGLAMSSGDHPATLVSETDFRSQRYKLFRPVPRPKGLVRYREALSGSYNASAFRILEKLGLPRFFALLERAGLGPFPLDPRDYGLPMALGATHVRLVDLASAYGFLVRQGRIIKHRSILSVTSALGHRWTPPPREERRLFSPQVSWQVMDILADASSRHKVFGQELPFDLPYRIAAKTGTALGIADTAAIGVTREWTVAAWAGTSDGSPMQGLLAMRSAAPLVRAGLLTASQGRPLSLPSPPTGLSSLLICPTSGQLHTPQCPYQRKEYFVSTRLPKTPCTTHAKHTTPHRTH